MGNLEDTQWAKAYLQQADTIRFYIKELKQQMNCSDCFGQSTVKSTDRHIVWNVFGLQTYRRFLHKRAQVEKVLKQERRERASVKRLLNLDTMTESIFGMQQYQSQNSSQMDTEYRRMLKVLTKAMQGELTKDNMIACMLIILKIRHKHKLQKNWGLELLQ